MRMQNSTLSTLGLSICIYFSLFIVLDTISIDFYSIAALSMKSTT